MAATEHIPWRMPLALRIFLFGALLVALVAGAAVAISYSQAQRIAGREVHRALGSSVALQREFEQHRLEQLQAMIQQMAADAAFVGYVVDAQTRALGLDDGGTSGNLSVRDLLLERQAALGFDLGMVLDSSAVMLARTDQTESFADDMRDDPMIGAAHDELAPFSGYWRLDDALYQAAVMPLQQDRDLAGFLLLAERIDDDDCQRIAAVSGAEVAYLFGEGEQARVVATSLPAADRQVLVRALARAVSRTVADVPRLQLDLSQSGWLAQTAPTADAGTPELGTVVTLASMAQAGAGYKTLRNQLLLAGLTSLALGLVLSYALARNVLRPLRRLAEAAGSAAAGDYNAQVAMGGNDELGRLSRSVDALLASLRERSDIAGYLGNRARALPDPSDAASGWDGRMADHRPPRRQQAVLLAVTLPDTGNIEAEDWSTRVQHKRLVVAGLLAAGRHAAAALRRDHLLVAFTGAQSGPEALRGLANLRARLGKEGANLPAMAVHVGEVGMAGLGESASVDGAAADLVARLLDQVPDDVIGLTPAATALCRGILGERSAHVGRTRQGTPLLCLRTEPLAALRSGTADRPLPAQKEESRQGPAAGSILGGRYQVMSTLGSGGMGVVYKVRDLDLDEIVALKMLRPGSVADMSQLERLKDELRLARRITHPNVLRTFDYVEIDGQPCISMEYVRGMTLRYLLDTSGRIPLSAGLRIARQLAAGLAAAHEVGVLHRDIKPENVILEANGNAKLMDFGIARPIRRSTPGQTQVGHFVGTPAYCAPEQLAGEEVDARSDLYALGVVMCEMFGGRLPHEGATTVELYLAKAQEPPRTPATLWPDIPDALDQAIRRCLEPEPGKRINSASELLAGLARLRG